MRTLLMFLALGFGLFAVRAVMFADCIASIAEPPRRYRRTNVDVALMGSGRWLVCIIFYAEPRVADMGQALLKCC